MPRYEKGRKLTQEEKDKAARTRARNKAFAKHDGITVKELKEREKAARKAEREVARAGKPRKEKKYSLTEEQKEKAARTRKRNKEEAEERGISVKELKEAKKLGRAKYEESRMLEKGRKRGAPKERKWSAAVYAQANGVSIEEARKIRARHNARKSRKKMTKRYQKYRKAYAESKLLSNKKKGEIVEVDAFYRNPSGSISRKVQRPGKGEAIPVIHIERGNKAALSAENPGVYHKYKKKELDADINEVRGVRWPGRKYKAGDHPQTRAATRRAAVKYAYDRQEYI